MFDEALPRQSGDSLTYSSGFALAAFGFALTVLGLRFLVVGSDFLACRFLTGLSSFLSGTS